MNRRRPPAAARPGETKCSGRRTLSPNQSTRGGNHGKFRHQPSRRSGRSVSQRSSWSRWRSARPAVPPRRDAKLKDVGHGVTASEIKVGIAIIDYDSIADFVDFDAWRPAEDRADLRRLHQQERWHRRSQDRAVLQEVRADPGPHARPAVALHLVDRGRRGVRGARRVHRLHRPGPALPHQGAQHHPHRPRARAAVDRRSRPPGLLLTSDTTKESAAKVLHQPALSSRQAQGQDGRGPHRPEQRGPHQRRRRSRR